jgi:hypothetical protein
VKLSVFLEQPIKGQCFFAKLVDEAAKRCESTCQLLDMSKHLRRLHADDGLYLLRVAFDSSLGDQIA